MADNTPSSCNRTRKPGTLYRIAGYLWVLVGVMNAIYGQAAQTATSFALGAVFLILGRSKARRAQQPNDPGKAQPEP
jgi:hypothetical protein